MLGGEVVAEGTRRRRRGDMQIETELVPFAAESSEKTQQVPFYRADSTQWKA